MKSCNFRTGCTRRNWPGHGAGQNPSSSCLYPLWQSQTREYHWAQAFVAMGRRGKAYFVYGVIRACLRFAHPAALRKPARIPAVLLKVSWSHPEIQHFCSEFPSWKIWWSHSKVGANLFSIATSELQCKLQRIYTPATLMQMQSCLMPYNCFAAITESGNSLPSSGPTVSEPIFPKMGPWRSCFPFHKMADDRKLPGGACCSSWANSAFKKPLEKPEDWHLWRASGNLLF